MNDYIQKKEVVFLLCKLTKLFHVRRKNEYALPTDLGHYFTK